MQEEKTLEEIENLLAISRQKRKNIEETVNDLFSKSREFESKEILFIYEILKKKKMLFSRPWKVVFLPNGCFRLVSLLRFYEPLIDLFSPKREHDFFQFPSGVEIHFCDNEIFIEERLSTNRKGSALFKFIEEMGIQINLGNIDAEILKTKEALNNLEEIRERFLEDLNENKEDN